MTSNTDAANVAGMKNEISILGPEEIGKAVRTALKSSHKDGIALILINSRHECSHSDGGCRIVARALKQIIPDGRIVTMVSRSVHLGSIWSPTHYGFRLPGDTGVIDGRGRAFVRVAALGAVCQRGCGVG